MKSNFKNTAILLKNARQAAGISQREFGEFMGHSSAQFISNIERGRSSIPMEVIVGAIKKLKVKKSVVMRTLVEDHREILSAEIEQLLKGDK